MQNGAKYIVEKHWIHVSLGVGIVSSFFEDKVRLDSSINETFYYHIKRTPLVFGSVFGEFSDLLEYDIKIPDSAIYFTGNVRMEYDSTVFFENGLIFDLKLKIKDTLKIRSNKTGFAKYLIKKIYYTDSLNSIRYELKPIEGFVLSFYSDVYDTRIGFRSAGLLPFEISAVGFTSYINTIAICSDSIIYVDKSLFKKFGFYENFCDSTVIDSLIRGILATDISKIQTICDFKIFPNPFNDYIKIDISEEFLYSIFNLDGRLIANGMTIAQINTSTFERGTYIIEIITETQNVKKINCKTLKINL